MASETSYFLTYLNGPNQGQKVGLDPEKPELTLGRSPDVDLSIDNKNISRKHIKFKQDIDGVWAEDLKSKNGVWINGVKITDPVLLHDADEIQLGDLKLSFIDSNAAILKSLSALPAFAEPVSEKPAEEALKEVKKPIVAAGPPPTPPSPWLDYAYVGLMGVVVLGLLLGALLWLRG